MKREKIVTIFGLVYYLHMFIKTVIYVVKGVKLTDNLTNLP